MNDKNILEKRPLILEIIGPAGAGKSTLLRVLRQRQKIQPDITLSKMQQFPFFISNTFSFLPTYLCQYRHSRWFNRREIRSMIYLKAVHHILTQKASFNSDMLTILDHGPIYRLAFLRELGPDITTSQQYIRWWANLLNMWLSTINMLIWLDAPNEVLLHRIRARDCRHTIKAKKEHEAYEFLNHYRTFLEQLIAESVADRRITILRFDTTKKSVEQIAEKVLAQIDSPPLTSPQKI